MDFHDLNGILLQILVKIFWLLEIFIISTEKRAVLRGFTRIRLLEKVGSEKTGLGTLTLGYHT